MNAEETDRFGPFARSVAMFAVHEAGHLVVAHHFNHHSAFKVWVRDSDCDPGWCDLTGRCDTAFHTRANYSNFAFACMGWAGVVAELIACHGFDVDLAALRKLDVESPEDRAQIVRYPQRLRAAKRAAEIIMAHRQALQLAVQKVHHELVNLRESVSWVRPEDIGLTPIKGLEAA